MSSPPHFPFRPPAKSRWRKWSLILLVLAVVMIAATLPFQGRFDLVLRPLIVIAVLFFVGTRMERRR